MSALYSLDELKKLVRKIEVDMTEHKLLSNLIDKAKTLGETEQKRLRRLGERVVKLSKSLDELKFYRAIFSRNVDEVKNIPVGSVDGSFQVIGGVGGMWYMIVGAAYVTIPNGFGGAINYKVDADIKPKRYPDESFIRREAEIFMMLLETKCIRKLRSELSVQRRGNIFIDGPIMDPWWCFNKDYISNRVEVIKESLSSGIRILGIVKRIMGSIFLREIQELVNHRLLEGYVCDHDFISPILSYYLIKKKHRPVFTKPFEYPRDETDLSDYDNKICKLYKMYLNEGIHIYYSYFKNSVRSKAYRVELVTKDELSEEELDREYMKVAQLIDLWSLPGFDIPLPVIIAHDKCNIRKGVAEKLYYEIITKMLNQEQLTYLASLFS